MVEWGTDTLILLSGSPDPVMDTSVERAPGPQDQENHVGGVHGPVEGWFRHN